MLKKLMVLCLTVVITCSLWVTVFAIGVDDSDKTESNNFYGKVEMLSNLLLTNNDIKISQDQAEFTEKFNLSSEQMTTLEFIADEERNLFKKYSRNIITGEELVSGFTLTDKKIQSLLGNSYGDYIT